MLTEKDKERISKEEIFRQEVRKEIEKNGKNISKKEKIWTFLNSSFALWFLSTIMVGLATFIYTSIKTNSETFSQKKEIERKLNLEISNRLQNSILFLEALKDKVMDTTSYISKSQISEEVLNKLGYENRPDFTNYFYQEYQKRNFASLLIELKSVSSKVEEKQLNTSLSGYKDLEKILLSGTPYYAYGDKISKQNLKEVLNSINDIKLIILKKIMLDQWKN